jgi:PIN domain nuclease of toxin-antitoxin system
VTNLLLDTHAFIWYSENDPKLPESIKIDIENADRVYLSIASLWEIAIKLSIGKLSLRSNYESIESSLEPAGIILLPISSNSRILAWLKVPAVVNSCSKFCPSINCCTR